MLGAKVLICRPADPEAKGLVERAHDYYERSFLPGRMFTSPADFNTQLAEWIGPANVRHHRVLGCRPIERWATDKAAMLPLPPVAPALGWRHSVRLPRDHYVRIDANDYSVDPRVIGRRVEVVADLDQVRVCAGGQLVADHAALLGRASDHHRSRARRGRGRAAGSGSPARPPVDAHQVEVRDLSSYDRVFGLDGEVA